MQASARRQAAQAGRAGGVTWTNPGAKGSNFHFQAVCAEAAMAWPVPPWYER